MSEPTKQRANLDTTWNRLLARSEAIERQLEASLQRSGLSREVLKRALDAAGGHDALRLAELQRELETAPAAVAELSFDELCRPAAGDISGGRSSRWLRV